MFDDVNNKKRSEAENQSAGQALPKDDTMPAGSLPTQPKETPTPFNAGAMPAGEQKKKTVEDIFADSDKNATNQPTKPTSLNNEHLTKPAVFQPKAEGSADSVLGDEKEELMSTGIDRIKKYFVLAVIVLSLVLVGLISFWVYGNFFKADLVGEEEQSSEVEKQAGDIETETTQQVLLDKEDLTGQAEEKQTEEKKETVQTSVLPEDSDQDGLSDEEEKQLGTDINSVDSDDDGLFDREEVKVYKTDPLKADTDNDGYLDGDEVKNGYDPKGPGRLYEIK